MSAEPGELLAALLDTVIPASGDMPGAGAHGLAADVVTDAAGTPLANGLEVVLAALPDGFARLDQTGREDALGSVADAEPAAVAAVVNLTYTAYYTDPTVLGLVERHTGYNAGPPQPSGYELPVFDPAVLSRTRRSAPIWREA